MAKNNFDNQVDNYLGFLKDEKNEYVTAAVSLFLILYAGVIAPKLPSSVLSWFDNWLVQIALFFAIVYISQKNATVALIAAVAVLVTLMITNNQITLKKASTSTVPVPETFCNACGSCANNNNYIPYDDTVGGVLDNGASLADADVPISVTGPMNARTNVGTSTDIAKKPMVQKLVHNASEEVEGILDETIAEHDNSVAGLNHAVNGGATTSRGGPKMPSKLEPNFPSHKPHTETETEGETEGEVGAEGEQNQNQNQNFGVQGIQETEMEDEVAGSSLDETRSMGSENESAEHNGEGLAETETDMHQGQNLDHVPESVAVPVTATEMVQASVEHVTAEVEQETGLSVPAETQMQVLSEVKQRVASLASKGRAVGDFDVVTVCREVYRRRY